MLRVPGFDNVKIELETAVLVAIFGSWEKEDGRLRNDFSPFGINEGDVRAYTFDFSPINNIVFAGHFSNDLFPGLYGEIFYNREISNAGEVGSVYQLNSNSYRVQYRFASGKNVPIDGTLELVSRGR